MTLKYIFVSAFLGKLKAQHFSSPSSRLVENNINTSGSGGLSSSFTSGCLEKYLLSIIPCRENIYFTSDTDNPCTDVEMELCLLRIQRPVYSLYLYFCPRMWEQCWCVLTAANPVLDAADCRHAAALPDVHCQGGPGDHTSHYVHAASGGCLVSFINFRMCFV